MLRLNAKTKLTQEEAVKYALEFFRGHRMNITSQSSGCVSFEGGGGGVSVETSVKDGLTVIDLVSRQWDKQVKDFVELLPERVKSG